jgi:hypothetical protein
MIFLLWLLSRKVSPRKELLFLGLLAADLLWTAGELIRPFPEDRITEINPIVALLQTAAKTGERSYAPYGGVDMAQMVRYDLRAADGYDSFVLGDYAQLGQYIGGCEDARYAVSVPSTASSPDAVKACPEFIPRMPVLALLNIRYLILPYRTQLLDLREVLSFQGLWVYQLPPGYGEAFGATEGIIASPNQCLEKLGQADPAHQVVLEEPLPFPADGKPISVVSTKAKTNRTWYSVRAVTSGMLVRSESWAPGWKAFIDGRPVKVYRVDCALQGVWVEGGDHTIEFVYAPNGYQIGRWISLIGAAALLLGWLLPIGIRRFRREDPGRAPIPRGGFLMRYKT